MQRALRLNAKIIGINNRNLKNLTIDLATTELLMEGLSDKDKKGRLFISESGITNHSQVRRLSSQVDGFLVGSSVMGSNSVEDQCKSLIYGRTKICGLTSNKVAKLAEENGAVYGGLIFHTPSPRNISKEKAKQIVTQSKLNFVGVFVNKELDRLIELVDLLKLSIVQLHGNEDQNYINQLKSRLPQLKIWKAIKVNNSLTEDNLQSLALDGVDKFLFDRLSSSLEGGSGKSFDWSLLQNLDKNKIILAGGLNSKNINQAITLGVYALDINSGLETSPGVKSKEKITQLFAKLRT